MNGQLFKLGRSEVRYLDRRIKTKIDLVTLLSTLIISLPYIVFALMGFRVKLVWAESVILMGKSLCYFSVKSTAVSSVQVA